MAIKKEAKTNPAQKMKYKRAEIELWEVDNGFKLHVKWQFHDAPDCGNDEDANYRHFVAKTEVEALEIIRNTLPSLVTDDE